MNRKISIECCADCPYCEPIITGGFSKDPIYSCTQTTGITIDSFNDNTINANCPLEYDYKITELERKYLKEGRKFI